MGDKNNYKLLIYSNSNELQLFLKSRKMENFSFYLQTPEEKYGEIESAYFNGDNIYVEGIIKILVLNTDKDNYRVYYKDISNLRKNYELIFLYGINNSGEFSFKNLYDIHFKDFNSFINFFEMVYYTFNGLNYFSLGIELFIEKFGSNPSGIRIITRKKFEEIINDLAAYEGRINNLLYFEKGLSKKNNIFKVSEKLQRIIDFLNYNGCYDIENIFSWIVVDNDENDEEFLRIFVR